MKIRCDEFLERPNVKSKSEVEVVNHLIDLRDQRLISEDELIVTEHMARRALKAVVGLIRHLESTPDPPRPPKYPKNETRERSDEGDAEEPEEPEP